MSYFTLDLLAAGWLMLFSVSILVVLCLISAFCPKKRHFLQIEDVSRMPPMDRLQHLDPNSLSRMSVGSSAKTWVYMSPAGETVTPFRIPFAIEQGGYWQNAKGAEEKKGQAAADSVYALQPQMGLQPPSYETLYGNKF